MIAIVCVLAVGFITVAPFLQQEAYSGADQYDYDAYKVYSFATGEFLYYSIVGGGLTNTSHYGYYHDPGSSTTALEHAYNWPGGHDTNVNMHILGSIWI
ncbi:MAG: hypothetical protein OXI24_07645 [Candidatus Poribacteria bacterium]|nr:hypothetical protein [Candidatus Poribacteria bacterium]